MREALFGVRAIPAAPAESVSPELPGNVIFKGRFPEDPSLGVEGSNHWYKPIELHDRSSSFIARDVAVVEHMGRLPQLSTLCSPSRLLGARKAPNYLAVTVDLADRGPTWPSGLVQDVPSPSEDTNVRWSEPQSCHRPEGKTVSIEFECADPPVVDIRDVKDPVRIEIRATNAKELSEGTARSADMK